MRFNRWVLSATIIFVSSPVAAEEVERPQGEFAISGKISGVVSGADLIVAGKSVHLEGTRAPKRGRTCLRNDASVDIGTEVAEGLARKIVGGEAVLSAHTDENGRLVGQGKVNGEDIGEIAIANGFAVTKIGDYRYAAQEREARNKRPGLWSCSSFPKSESAPQTSGIAPVPQPLPPPIEVRPRPASRPQSAVEYLPPDAPLPPPQNEPEDDFELALDDVGGFFEDIFSGIDRAIRDAFGAPPPPGR